MSARGAFQPLQRLSFLARFRQMPNSPTFVRRAMNPARGRDLNAMLPQGLRKPLPPALKIGLSWVQTHPIKACRFHGQMNMRMRRGVQVRIGLENSRAAKSWVARCTDNGSVRIGIERTS